MEQFSNNKYDLEERTARLAEDIIDLVKSIVITPKKSEVLNLAGKYKALTGKKRLNLDKIRERIDYSQL